MTFDLITFGDSVTKGCGLGYEEGMSHKEYQKIFYDEEINNKYAFRTILSDRWGCDNINFACMGSSNMKQFRLATEYFKSKPKRRTVVLWATSTVCRHEMWFNKRDKGGKGYGDLRYNHRYKLIKCQNEISNLESDIFRKKPKIKEDDDFEKGINIVDYINNHFDKENEVRMLSKQMTHWNLFFEGLGIENYWVDTGISHDYPSTNPRMLFNDKPKRDLLSQSQIKLDPYSGHPTKESHTKIADMIDEEINLINNIRQDKKRHE